LVQEGPTSHSISWLIIPKSHLSLDIVSKSWQPTYLSQSLVKSQCSKYVLYVFAGYAPHVSWPRTISLSSGSLGFPAVVVGELVVTCGSSLLGSLN
jgi:hypothetical protein